MIPTVLVVSFAIGRLWVIPVAAVAWTVLVSVFGDCGPSCWPAAAAFGAGNAAVGVALHILLVWTRRGLRALVR